MHALMTGWVRWREFKPVEHAMVSVGSRLLPPRRHELGDNDPSTWEIDDRGRQRDPWQLTSYLPMIADDDGEVFTFAASSKGGLECARQALANLCRAPAPRARRIAGRQPRSGGYQHPNRAYGYIKTPLFVVTGWAPVSRFNEIMALAGYDMPDSNEPAAMETPAAPPAVAKPDDMDDDIPF